jgi:hypothetical protein
MPCTLHEVDFLYLDSTLTPTHGSIRYMVLWLQDPEMTRARLRLLGGVVNSRFETPVVWSLQDLPGLRHNEGHV